LSPKAVLILPQPLTTQGGSDYKLIHEEVMKDIAEYYNNNQ